MYHHESFRVSYYLELRLESVDPSKDYSASDAHEESTCPCLFFRRLGSLTEQPETYYSMTTVSDMLVKQS